MITMGQKHELDLRDMATAARAEGEQRCARLTGLLLEAGRMDDIRKMAEDDDYFEQLCTEFGLSYE